MHIIAAVGGLSRLLIATATVLLASLFPTLSAHAPSTQDPDLFYNEVQTIYLTNQQRRAAGLPPVRWNRELTLARRVSLPRMRWRITRPVSAATSIRPNATPATGCKLRVTSTGRAGPKTQSVAMPPPKR